MKGRERWFYLGILFLLALNLVVSLIGIRKGVVAGRSNPSPNNPSVVSETEKSNYSATSRIVSSPPNIYRILSVEENPPLSGIYEVKVKVMEVEDANQPEVYQALSIDKLSPGEEVALVYLDLTKVLPPDIFRIEGSKWGFWATKKEKARL